MELLPDPRLERYRFTAEVRQDARIKAGEGGVGLYFGRHGYEFPTKDQAYHGMRLAFLDSGPERPEAPWARNVNLISFLKLQPFGRGESGDEIPRGTWSFVPVQQRPGPWRRLAVEVRPASVRALWWDEKTNKWVARRGPWAGEGAGRDRGIPGGGAALERLCRRPADYRGVSPPCGVGIIRL